MSDIFSNNIDIFEADGCDPGPRAGAKQGLSNVIPHPPGADFDKLEQIATRHRVLIWRGGAVIAITTVISVGGALLIHALAAGVLVVGFWFPAWIGLRTGGRTDGAGLADSGGSPGGYSILGEGPDDNAPPAPQLAEILGDSPAGTGVLPAILPTLPEATPVQQASQLALAEPLPVVSGDLGSVLLVRADPAPALPDTLVVAPPTALVTGPADPIGGGIKGLPARGTGEGDGGGDEERIFPLLRGDGSGGSGRGGVGTGSGKGRGSGIDRGMSAADRPAQYLDDRGPGFALPAGLRGATAYKNLKMCLHLRSDGSIAGVTVAQSCGDRDVDQEACDYVKAFLSFSPEYVAGKAVETDYEYTYSANGF
jgi:hypothetical protein